MISPGDGMDLLKTAEKSFVKNHCVYDINNRLTEMYEVWAKAPNNTPCIRTRYTYTSPTSSLIENLIEEQSVWNSAWDI